MYQHDYDLSMHKGRYYKKLRKELIPAAFHLRRWWDWGVLEDEKKRLRNYRANSS